MYEGELLRGDIFSVSAPGIEFMKVQLDKTMKESVIYCPSGSFEFSVPDKCEAVGYAPEAFSGFCHRIRISESDEAYEKRLISLNSLDRRGQTRYFPHARANLVTRDAPCFFERNAIDGVCKNNSHGDYPYHSWAGGAREDLEYYIDFGAEVLVSEIVFYLRADFPHDTYWKSLEIEFSDKERLTAEFSKTAEGQKTVLENPKKTRNVWDTYARATTPKSFLRSVNNLIKGNTKTARITAPTPKTVIAKIFIKQPQKLNK